MNLFEVVSKLPLNDQEMISEICRSVMASPDGSKMFNALDKLLTLHVDPLGTPDSALRETNAQRSLLSQMKFIASEEWQKNLKNQREAAQSQSLKSRR